MAGASVEDTKSFRYIFYFYSSGRKTQVEDLSYLIFIFYIGPEQGQLVKVGDRKFHLVFDITGYLW